MVGHLLLPPGGKKEMLRLGGRYLLHAHQRLNLGVVRKDESAWWSLAPHDV
jgi:hypothetical protein